MRALGLIAVLGLCACGKSDDEPAGDIRAPAAPADAAPARPPAAAGVTLRSASAGAKEIVLGGKFAPEVLANPPFDKPCDDNATGGKGDGMRSLVVYQASGCTKMVPGGGGTVQVPGFPDQTSVVFYLARPAGAGPAETPLDQPIVAMAWMSSGPRSYFAGRSNFPLETGVSEADVDRAFGPAAATIDLRFGGQVKRYGGDVYAIVDGGRAVGYAVGELPADPADSRWYVISKVWTKETRDVKPPGLAAGAPAGPVTREDCIRALAHVATVRSVLDKPGAQALRDRMTAAVDECLARYDAARLRCLESAHDLAALDRCQQ